MKRGRAIAVMAVATAVLVAATSLAAYGVLRGAGPPPPSYEEVRARWRPSQAWLLDRDGVPLAEQRMDLHALRDAWVPLQDFSPALRAAVLRAEDRRFYRHGGVDYAALAAAAWQYVNGDRRRGASTISMQVGAMQVAAMQFGDRQRAGRRDVAAKLRQIAAAWRIESAWTKDQILEAYLNTVGLRGELQGVPAAARSLFGKHVSGLDAQESLLLAASISSPNASAARLAQRACGLAAHGEAAQCIGLPLLASAATGGTLAAHRTAPPQLAPHLARRLLRSAGEQVHSTLSAPLQQRAHDVLERQLLSLEGENLRDGALVVLDNASGEVLAYVASAGPRSTARDVDGARALRQAGSTLKPFLYGLAFERHFLTPASLLDDSPLNLETATGLYIPQNYDRGFKGVVSARTALASSLNIPAVRTLVLAGVESFRDTLNAFGYDDIREDGEYYGYSLALGSAEVTLLQQANAYRALANGGLWSPLRITRQAAAPVAEPRRVLSPTAAFLVSEALADGAARSLTFGLDSALATPFWTAVKTGTSKDLRDNWCIGYSERYTVAVWVGNFEGDSMREVSGVTGAAPAWLEVMQYLHARVPSRAPAPPAGIVAREVAFEPAVEAARRGYFIAGTETSRVRLLQADAARPRIVSPANGAVIALDPDIPRRNQQLVLQSRGGPALAFFMDGEHLGHGGVDVTWTPQRGAHRLELRADDGRVQDAAFFTVR